MWTSYSLVMQIFLFYFTHSILRHKKSCPWELFSSRIYLTNLSVIMSCTCSDFFFPLAPSAALEKSTILAWFMRSLHHCLLLVWHPRSLLFSMLVNSVLLLDKACPNPPFYQLQKLMIILASPISGLLFKLFPLPGKCFFINQYLFLRSQLMWHLAAVAFSDSWRKAAALALNTYPVFYHTFLVFGKCWHLSLWLLV